VTQQRLTERFLPVPSLTRCYELTLALMRGE